jgi:hypothetical protein
MARRRRPAFRARRRRPTANEVAAVLRCGGIQPHACAHCASQLIARNTA